MPRPYGDPVEVVTGPIPAQSPFIPADAKIVVGAVAPASPDPIPLVLLPGFEYRLREWRHPDTHEIHWLIERRKSGQTGRRRRTRELDAFDEDQFPLAICERWWRVRIRCADGRPSNRIVGPSGRAGRQAAHRSTPQRSRCNDHRDRRIRRTLRSSATRPLGNRRYVRADRNTSATVVNKC